MVSDALCRCICGSSRFGDQLEKAGPACPSAAPPADVREEVDPKSNIPQVSGRLCYSMLADQPLRGVPIREGELWHLSAEDKIDHIHFVLHVNGFCFAADGQEVSISLSPFTLVRNCKFQSSYPNLNISDFKIFKVSLFAQGACYYFGVKGEDEREAEEERSRWVLDISRAMRLVTQSLFPPFQISCDPLPSLPATERRIMAGYLVHFDSCFTVSILYCELHPQDEDCARLVLYQNERCLVTVQEMFVTERSICCEKIGINCSCFSVEDHQFSARSLSERKLWLRAISNLKVKLQNRAPSPEDEDLSNYREAIREHVSKLQDSCDSHMLTDALLQRTTVRPPPDQKAGVESLGACPLPPSPMTSTSLKVNPPADVPEDLEAAMSGQANGTEPDQAEAVPQDTGLSQEEPQALRRSSSLTTLGSLPTLTGRIPRLSDRKMSWPTMNPQEAIQPPGDG